VTDSSPIRAAATASVVVLVAVGIAAEGIAVPWTVGGGSMTPTLRPGDRVLVDLWTYRHRAPRPGEVVLLSGPGDLPLVKRVSRVDRRNGTVWVVGDRPMASVDSRAFGALPLERIRGRVVYRFWPPERSGPIR
jgi:signal peptidase I